MKKKMKPTIDGKPMPYPSDPNGFGVLADYYARPIKPNPEEKIQTEDKSNNQED